MQLMGPVADDWGLDVFPLRDAYPVVCRSCLRLGRSRPSCEHRLPASLALPLGMPLAQQLGRPPVLSYASYALHNWRRLDPLQAYRVGQCRAAAEFSREALDEEWFVLIHIDIEAKAGIRGWRGLVQAHNAARGQ
jgi:indoleamine 2,3-dioxygenase